MIIIVTDYGANSYPAEWKVMKLGNISEVKGRIGFRGYTKADLVPKGKGALTIGAKHVTNDFQLRFDDPEYISWEKYYESPEIIVEEGDILVVQRGSIGKVAIVKKLDEPATINPSMVLLKKITCHSRYLYYWLSSEFIQKEIMKVTTSTAVPMISQGQIKDFSILLPPADEQFKIAEILSTVDEKIDVIEAQITQTQDLKRGLMQRLLTKGIGHTQFKDSPLGEIPDEWEVVNVGSVCKLQGGFAFKSSDACEKGVRWLKIANVSINKIRWDNASFLPIGFDEKYPDFLLNEGDIVIAMTRPILGNELKIARVTNYDKGSLLNQRVGRVQCNSKVESDFIYQIFCSPMFVTSLNKELLGTDPPNISSNMFEALLVPLPQLSEQRKIADILVSVDKKMEILQQKRTQCEVLKKCLMQQLLTGRLRVNQTNQQHEPTQSRRLQPVVEG